MKALVTGGAGFIGSHLVDRLIAEGHEVIVVDDLSCGSKEYLNKSAEFNRISITDRKAIRKIIEKERPATVFHLAAQKDLRRSVDDPVSDAETNIIGTLNLLEPIAEIGGVRVVFPSSAAVYPIQTELPIREDSQIAPESPYGISKRSAEMYLAYYSNLYPVSCVALRLANVYGPRQCSEGASVISLYARALLSGRPVTINGSGEQTRDFIFVDDVVDAMIRMMRVEWCGEINISTGIETSINAVYGELQKIIGGAPGAERANAKDGEIFRSVLDSSLAAHTLGWRATTTLEIGLAKTVEWMRNNL